MNPHQPLRPSWDCAACGQPWPCRPARERMAAEADTSLRIAAWSWLEEAMRDMPDAPAGQLWQRFVGWTRTGKAGEPAPPS